jgi:5S rRNA maturation endonuclease (ribonuclease M5)
MSSKTLLNCIFVAEGKRDEERLKKLDIPYIVRTDGLNVPRETTKHLQELAKVHEVIILTDPDAPKKKRLVKVMTFSKSLAKTLVTP